MRKLIVIPSFVLFIAIAVALASVILQSQLQNLGEVTTYNVNGSTILVSDTERLQFQVATLVSGYLILLALILFVIFAVSLLIGILFRGTKWVLHRIFGSEAVRATTSVHRLVALAATAFLFPETLYSLWQVVMRIGAEIFMEGPRALGNMVTLGIPCIHNASRNVIAGPDGGFVTQCVSVLMDGAGSTLTGLVSGIIFRSGLSSLSITPILLFTLAFVILSIVASFIENRMTVRGHFWLGYAGIALTAIYLALSATLAVALMSSPERDDEELAPTRLREHLGELADAFALPPADQGELAANAVVETSTPVDNMVASGAVGALDTPEKSDDYRIRYFIDVLGQIDQKRLEVESRIRDLTARAPSTATLVSTAVNAYENETLTRRGSREAALHYQTIASWFRSNLNAMLSALQTCDIAMNTIDTSHNVVERTIVQVRGYNLETPSDHYDDSLSLVIDAQRNAFEASSSCPTFFEFDHEPPSRPAFGSSLGTIGAAVMWLLATESVQLTLITGLVGFGLLGALVSRFVGAGAALAYSENLADMAIVVFSGFVAALIVYLAAYGGIAVVSETPGEPNPYLVFAACLVGAVYSTQVWDRARLRVLGAERP